eukprot:364124-Chlamydomonas_euryale.AAC.6
MGANPERAARWHATSTCPSSPPPFPNIPHLSSCPPPLARISRPLIDAGVSVGHNLSMAMCGGTAPLLATALMSGSGSDAAPAGMLAAAALVSAGGVALGRWLFGMT